MRTVYIKTRASNNLKKTFERLITQKRYNLSRVEALAYVDDLKNICYSLIDLDYHHTAIRTEHYKFGQKVHTYKRNWQTEWYFIYDIDKYENIIVKRIMCNNEMRLTS